MQALFMVAIVGAMALSGCGKKDGADKKAGPQAKSAGVQVSGAASTAAAEATKLVPADLAAKLKFETTKDADARVVFPVPKGWEEAKHVPGKFKPADSSLGFMSGYSVGSNCDGSRTRRQMGLACLSPGRVIGSTSLLRVGRRTRHATSRVTRPWTRSSQPLRRHS